MRAPNRMLTTFGALLLVLLAAGLYELSTLRSESGDIFPEYSTLRADPMGAKAFFEALQEIPGLTVRQNFRPLKEIREADATVFYLGTGAVGFTSQNKAELDELTRVATAGNRLVITLRPVTSVPFERLRPEQQDTKKEIKPDPLEAIWGVKVKYRTPSKNESEEQLGINETPRWTLAYFEPLAKQWQVKEQFGEFPTTIERPFGKGSIVLKVDSFLFSNEAQWRERHAGELTALIGPHRTVVFDEAHLGAVQEGSVAGLVRRYHLQGFVLGLLVLTGLFFWQGAMPFLPPHSVVAAAEIRGQSASAGFVRLLRRSIPASAVLATCWQEWERTKRLLPRYRADKIARAETIAQGADEPLTKYGAIRRVLAERE